MFLTRNVRKRRGEKTSACTNRGVVAAVLVVVVARKTEHTGWLGRGSWTSTFYVCARASAPSPPLLLRFPLHPVALRFGAEGDIVACPAGLLRSAASCKACAGALRATTHERFWFPLKPCSSPLGSARRYFISRVRRRVAARKGNRGPALHTNYVPQNWCGGGGGGGERQMLTPPFSKWRPVPLVLRHRVSASQPLLLSLSLSVLHGCHLTFLLPRGITGKRHQSTSPSWYFVMNLSLSGPFPSACFRFARRDCVCKRLSECPFRRLISCRTCLSLSSYFFLSSSVFRLLPRFLRVGRSLRFVFGACFSTAPRKARPYFKERAWRRRSPFGKPARDERHMQGVFSVAAYLLCLFPERLKSAQSLLWQFKAPE